VCAQLHFNICKETGVKLDNEHWYDHVPKLVKTNLQCKVTTLWNQLMKTDRTMPNNKPGILIHNDENGPYFLKNETHKENTNLLF
jgi:hypothetical protein